MYKKKLKKNDIKRGEKFFLKKGGGYGFEATSPCDFDNIHILSISPPGYQRVTSQKKGILVTFRILI
jgi:hypothetical protein